MEIPLYKDPTQYEESPQNYCLWIMEIIYCYSAPYKMMMVLIDLLKYRSGFPNFSIEADFLKKTVPNPDIEKDNPIEPTVNPHAVVRQDPFGVYLEKYSEKWLKEEYVANKLSEFEEAVGNKVILLLSKYEEENYKEKFQKVVQLAEKQNIILEAVSYKDFLGAIIETNIEHSPILKEVYEKTKEYFEKHELI